MPYRIGIGYDIHRLVKGRRLVLGGIVIPHHKGLKGHSDADALLHAICDAILGAAAAGDIGELFPDTDAKYRGISSLELLKRVNKLVGSKGYIVKNIDSTIIAEKPKVAPFKKKMIKNIAATLTMREKDINIKATTNEGVGEIGRKKAIAAYAVALLENK